MHTTEISSEIENIIPFPGTMASKVEYHKIHLSEIPFFRKGEEERIYLDILTIQVPCGGAVVSGRRLPENPSTPVALCR